MFIRTKRIKGNDYAYLVRNVWRKRPKSGERGSRQKVSKYLGRIYRFEDIYHNSFVEFYKIKDIKDFNKYIDNKSKKDIIKDLIKIGLINIGFKEQGRLLVNDDLKFDIDNLTFSDKAVIEMNEGFLCKDTVSKIINFKAGDEEREGYNLANAFVEAGLKVPEEVFVGYYKRFFSV